MIWNYNTCGYYLYLLNFKKHIKSHLISTNVDLDPCWHLGFHGHNEISNWRMITEKNVIYLVMEKHIWIHVQKGRIFNFLAGFQVGLDFTPRFCKTDADKDSQRHVLKHWVSSVQGFIFGTESRVQLDHTKGINAHAKKATLTFQRNVLFLNHFCPIWSIVISN